MIRKPWLRWPLSIILGLLLLLNLQQGLGTLLRGEDWSGNYATVEATIVGSVETEWPGSTTENVNRDRFSCVPVLEVDVDGVRRRTEADWWAQSYSRSRGPDCVDQAYGETVTVLMSPSVPSPIFLDPDNPPTAEGTSLANLAIAAFALFLLWLLWRPNGERKIQ